jgi:hypothetical protein
MKEGKDLRPTNQTEFEFSSAVNNTFLGRNVHDIASKPLFFFPLIPIKLLGTSIRDGLFSL